MNSVIAGKIHLKYEPVSITLSDDKPDNAVEFKPGKFACVMSLLATAVKGRPAVGSRNTNLGLRRPDGTSRQAVHGVSIK